MFSMSVQHFSIVASPSEFAWDLSQKTLLGYLPVWSYFELSNKLEDMSQAQPNWLLAILINLRKPDDD